VSDEHLRELERRSKETGSPEDEAAWIRERVRIGELARERVELAAYCGHAGARLVSVGQVVPTVSADWLQGLYRWGETTYARATLACSRSLLPAPSEQPYAQTLQQAMAAAEALLRCPCKEHLRLASNGEYAAAWAGGSDAKPPERNARDDPRWLAWEPVDLDRETAGIVGRAAEAILGSIEMRLGRRATADDARAAASEALVIWALAGSRGA
jgi:hypothetical protein